jgi:methylmalonyl-CoA/ethylmalonyl-CoA epimerase
VFDAIDHVGIAVEEIDAALETYAGTFGMELVHRQRVPAHGVELAMLAAGLEHVELVAPLAPDTPVGRFLASRGPGIHHVAYRVADIDATLAALRQRDVELLDETPREGALESRIAFLHPRSAGGVLTEIVQRSAS